MKFLPIDFLAVLQESVHSTCKQVFARNNA
jgi:hypothetical protein